MIVRALSSAVVTAAATGGAAVIAFGVGGAGGVLGGDSRQVSASAGGGGLVLNVSGPLFTETGLRPGSVAERCVRLENQGTAAAEVALYGPRGADALTPHLHLHVTGGSGASGAPGSCTGFTPLAQAFGGAPGVQFSGALSAFPEQADAAVRPGDRLQPGEQRVYRLRVTVADGGNSLQGLSAMQDFTFAAIDRSDAGPPTTPPPTSPPAAPTAPSTPAVPSEPSTPSAPVVLDPTQPAEARRCARVDVTGRAAGRRVPAAQTRRPAGASTRAPANQRLLLPRKAKRAAKRLGLRVWTNARGTRLVLAAGERRTGGMPPRRTWARVTYRLNGTVTGRAARPPFAWQVRPEQLRPGVNSITMVVKPRRGASMRAEFRLSMRAWGTRPAESVCSVT